MSSDCVQETGEDVLGGQGKNDTDQTQQNNTNTSTDSVQGSDEGMLVRQLYDSKEF